MKLHFEWVSKEKMALHTSQYHAQGERYQISRKSDAEFFKSELRKIGAKMRAEYTKLGEAGVLVKLQIDSAGGHGLAREKLRSTQTNDE
jgi:hypothetical protein